MDGLIMSKAAMDRYRNRQKVIAAQNEVKRKSKKDFLPYDPLYFWEHKGE